MLEEGIAGQILTDFLAENIHEGFPVPLESWEAPLEMLQVAVTYARTGEEMRLLSLPLEQRQLLNEVLPPTVGERHAGCRLDRIDLRNTDSGMSLASGR